MFLNRNKKGFGWYSSVSTESIGLKDPLYLNFSFKKDCEPSNEELNQYGSLSGDLYFVTESGKRRVFPVAKEYNGKTYIEFKILELEGSEKKAGPAVQSYKPDEIQTTIDDGGFGTDNLEGDPELPWY